MNLVWRKSSRSASNGGNCVEVAELKAGRAIRDSKNPTGPHLTLPLPAFTALLTAVKAGQLHR